MRPEENVSKLVYKISNEGSPQDTLFIGSKRAVEEFQ